MIHVKLPKDKSKWGFTFRYYREMHGQPTECKIIRNGEVFSNGVVTLYFTDSYDKRYGRKAAFTKAIEPLPKLERTVFWKYFLRTCHV